MASDSSSSSQKPASASYAERQARELTRRLKRYSAVAEEQEIERAARAAGIPYIDLNFLPIPAADVHLIREEDAVRLNLASFFRAGHTVRIATSAPGSAEVKEFIETFSKEHDVTVSLFTASHASLLRAWRGYHDVPLTEVVDTLSIHVDAEEAGHIREEVARLSTLRTTADLSTTTIIEILLGAAITMDASDVHIEPQKDTVRIRFRIDGVLQEIVKISQEPYHSVVSRIKVMSALKLNISKTPQDGRFSFSLGSATIDVRTSILPGAFGENIVLRLLNSAEVILSINDLKMGAALTEKLVGLAHRTSGMFLTTGPTGSGKTTTLYTLLRSVASGEKKVITLEDPIEYAIDNVEQTQVSTESGYTFSSGLRAILRQDPDVIMVGEIRDEETADIALQASLTGHFVLSTLHANSAVAAIARLIELGMKPTAIPTAVTLLMAQRLVRRLCEHCKESYAPAESTVAAIERILSLLPPSAHVDRSATIDVLYRPHPQGCPRCNFLGYKGRVGIFEAFSPTGPIAQAILDLSDEETLLRHAIENGMITMIQDGLLKAIAGITSVEELWRVTTQNEFLEALYDELMAQAIGRTVLVDSETVAAVAPEGTIAERTGTVIETAASDHLLSALCAVALAVRASDIHCEPQEDGATIRLRVDGVLHAAAHLTATRYQMLLGAIKKISGLAATARHGASDSRFAIKRADHPGEEPTGVRVSMIPSGYGETVMLRLLSRSSELRSLETLGMNPYNIERVKRAIRRPMGMLLMTGPTGSGKTTTLYSILSQLNTPDTKIMTIEDPIEYQLPGILQTQIDEKENYTFAVAMRAFLRQNPNIIMVGEIRDEETAGIALQASLTGHMVISTLHANNAATTLDRFLTLGVRAEDVASALTAIVAQRLVRRLCPFCRSATTPNHQTHTFLAELLSTVPYAIKDTLPSLDTIYTASPKGCSRCSGGYFDRTVISEVLLGTDTIKETIVRDPLVTHIQQQAQNDGMLTLEQDAAIKILTSETTLEEVARVLDLRASLIDRDTDAENSEGSDNE